MSKQQLIEESKKRFLSSKLSERFSPSDRQWMMIHLSDSLSLIYDKAVEEMREKIEQYPEKLKSIMPEGKLPFVVFQGKATEEEKWVIYSQAFKDILSTLTPKGEK